MSLFWDIRFCLGKSGPPHTHVGPHGYRLEGWKINTVHTDLIHPILYNRYINLTDIVRSSLPNYILLKLYLGVCVCVCVSFRSLT